MSRKAKSENLPVVREKPAKLAKTTSDKLTALQVEFCNEYALTGYRNATQAYIRASQTFGKVPDYKGAAVSANKLLKMPKITTRIARIKAKAELQPFAVSLEEIQRDLYEVVQVGLGRLPAARIDRIKGHIVGVDYLPEFDGSAANNALDKLARIAGGYSPDNNGAGLNVKINIDLGSQATSNSSIGPHPTVARRVIDGESSREGDA